MTSPIEQKIKAVFRGVKTSGVKNGRLTIIALPANAVDILKSLKDERYRLALISCVDWINKRKLELVYVLSSNSDNDHVIVKTSIPRENPDFRSITNVFENAEPYERELHELFGIKFEGHPRLTRLFLERDYAIPPFRKDFDTRKYVEEFFDKIPPVETKG